MGLEENELASNPHAINEGYAGKHIVCLSVFGAKAPSGPGSPHLRGF
jgi:hypothetical protein